MERYAERTLTVPDNVYVVEHREKGGLQPVDGLPSGATHIVIGCGKSGCTECSQLPEGYELQTPSVSGMNRSRSPGRPDLYTGDRYDGRPYSLLDANLSDQPLCSVCHGLDIKRLAIGREEQEHYDSFYELTESANTCPLCNLFLRSLPQPNTYYPFSELPLTVHGNFGGLTMDFPSFEAGSGGMVAQRRGELRLLVPHRLPHPSMSELQNRQLRAAPDLLLVNRWLSTCMSDHHGCAKPSMTDGTPSKPFLPTRLIHVGCNEDHTPPFLDDREDREGPYATLSHRWGKWTDVIKTTKATLSTHRQQLPLQQLSRTFQDAIYLTRKLHIRYLWIDSLCIVQDDGDDKSRELPMMVDIYEKCTLMLSASVAEDGSDGLIPTRAKRNQIEMEYRDDTRRKVGTCYVSDWEPPGFEADVIRGALGQRAWCLQERILPPRILHFGKEQLHFECCAGVWSESSSLERKRGNITANDDAGDLRRMFAFGEAPAAEAADSSIDLGPAIVAINDKRALRDWYHMITTYTTRQLTYNDDKLRALSGVARRFAQLNDEEYVAGLWASDLTTGLLWSATGLFNTFGTVPRIPLRRRSGDLSPTWSWASVDGPVLWPTQTLGQSALCGIKSAIQLADSDRYGAVGSCTLLVMGFMRDCREILGLNEQDWQWIEAQASSTHQEDLIRKDIDDDRFVDPELPTYCLLLRKRARSETALAYGMLLQECGDITPHLKAFRRVGLAQVSVTNFFEVKLEVRSILIV